MNEKTLQDLAEVARLEAEIDSRRRLLSSIHRSCAHLDYRTDLVETFQFEHTPARICLVCHRRLPGITDAEKEALWRLHYEDQEEDLSPEVLAQILNGR